MHPCINYLSRLVGQSPNAVSTAEWLGWKASAKENKENVSGTEGNNAAQYTEARMTITSKELK